MKILKGVIVSNKDMSETGRLSVIFPTESQSIKTVVYTTPFYMANGGGLLAIPEYGARILATYDEDSDTYYYLSTILTQDDKDFNGSSGLKDFSILGDKNVYSERKKPSKIKLTNQLNAGLAITRKYQPDYIVNKVDLTSEKGKRVSLNDSPKTDAVIVRNEHGDGLIITSESTETHPDRSIEIKSVGPQRHVVYQSDMNFMIVDGKDVNIENYSTGAFADNSEGGRFGNINLRSENADITIVSKADDGRVFIVTPNARIQISPDGKVQVKADSDIELVSDTNITIQAANNLNLVAANVNIKADANIAMDAGGNSSILSTGTNSLDGAQVHFNSGLSLPVTVDQPGIPETNDYNE